jgi:protein TonB
MSSKALSLPPLPSHDTDGLPPLARHALLVGVLGAHFAGAWALMQVDAVRDAVAEVAPIMVEMLAPPAPPKPLPPPPPPPPKVVQKTPPPPKPLITSEPATPAPAPFVAPPPPVEPAPPAPPIAVEAPPAPPAPPPQIKTLPATAVRYTRQCPLEYPAASRRLGESGKVVLRILVDEKGMPREVTLQKSSGFARLDAAALRCAPQSRFQPYSENGIAQAVYVPAPFTFDLEE